MKILTTIAAMQSWSAKARKAGKRIGFVPTMGYLHQGHTALLRACRKKNDLCVLSIFVNPLQFGPQEDFRRYPRNKKHDEMLAKKEKVDIIFYPSVKEMYPTSYGTKIDVGPVANVLCGSSRPGHFRGVATVVAKLINAVNPHTLYLGQKDAQQVIVIKKMVEDLGWPLCINEVPTVREKDGLALSSRNSYLSAKERDQARALSQALRQAYALIKQGERSSQVVRARMKKVILKNALAKIDYVQCVDATTLQPLRRLKGKILIALAVMIGKTRLIDNIQMDL